VRLRPLADLRELLHQLLVDVEAAGGVDDQDVATVGARLVERPLGDVDRVAAGALLVHGRAGLLADLHELIDRRGPVDVAGRDGDVELVLLAQVPGELAGGGGLARALEAGHQDHRRLLAREDEVAPRSAHQLRELVVDELHHLLAGVERVEDVGPERALLDGCRELLDDLEVDVGLEQREPDLAHGLVDVVLGELAARADVAEGGLEPF
jgi:hypothetical protein